MDSPETNQNKLQWSALEYEERERNPDWFWALGIIVVTSALTSIIYGNYFFAFFILLSGGLLGFFGKRAPEVVTYELNRKGFKIRNRVYLYENIKSFWVQMAHEGTPEHASLKPTLFIKTERFFMPVLSIPIENNLAHEIHDIMTAQDIPEEEMREHASEKVMEFLGF